jgi:hypothetical protein
MQTVMHWQKTGKSFLDAELDTRLWVEGSRGVWQILTKPRYRSDGGLQ